jgi:hypothetical protein
MPYPRAEIDASAAQLDLRMTEGDSIAFNFLVPGVPEWGGVTFNCQVRDTHESETPIATLTVVATTEGTGCDIMITSVPVAELVNGKYVWDMQEAGGITRFGGLFHVEKQVTR